MNTKLLLVAVVSTILSACGDGCDRAEEPSAPLTYVPVPTDVRCYTGAHAYALHDLGDYLATSYQPRRQGGTVDVSMASLTLLTQDEGRSFVRPVARMDRVNTSGYVGPLSAFLNEGNGVFTVGANTFVSTRGVAGASRLPGPEENFSDVDWLLFFGADVVGEDVFVSGESVTLPSGEASIRHWRHGDIEVAQAGMWLWASDGGGEFAPVGTVPVGVDLYSAASRLRTVVSRPDAAILSGDGFFLVRPGEEPRSISAGAGPAFQYATMNAGLWGDSVVLVAEDVPPLNKFWSIPFDGSAPTSHVWPLNVSSHVGFAESGDGSLFVYTKARAQAGEEAALLRLAPGAELFERLQLDFKAAPFDGIASAVGRDDGGALFIARTRDESAHAGTEHFGSTMFCRVGPDVAQGVEPLAFASMDDVVAQPGTMHRIARVGDGTTVSDRFVRTPAGTVFGVQNGYVRTGPPDVEPISLQVPSSVPNLPDALGYEPDTFLAFTDTSFVTSAWMPSQLLDPPHTQRVTIDLVEPTRNDRTSLGFGNEQIYDYQVSAGQALATTGRGTFPASQLPMVPRDRTEWGGNLILGRGHGYSFDRAYVYDRAIHIDDLPTYLTRFTPFQGAVPSANHCRDAEPLPEHCIALDDVAIVAARVNDAGDLFALDFRYGRVLRLPAGSSEPETVAEGLLSPSDLRLTQHDGQEVVMVYDGDVFAFVPTAKVAVRSYASGADNSRDLVGRALSTCAEGEPCVDRASFGGVLTGAGSQCVPGANFGDAGVVRFDGHEVDSEWSDREVCFDAGALGGHGQVVLETSSGIRTRPIPYYAPARVDSVDVPSPLTPRTPVVFRGENLNAAYNVVVHGGELVRASDQELAVLVPKSGEVAVLQGSELLMSREVSVAPAVEESCVAGPGQPCTMVVLGMPDNAGDVVVGGAAAQVLLWESPRLQFAWPASLAPGEHSVTISVEGGTAETTATLLPEALDVLSADVAFSSGYDRTLTAPIESDLGLIAPIRLYTERTPHSAIARLTPAGVTAQTTSTLNSATLVVVSDGTQTLVVGNSTTGLTVLRVTDPGNELLAFEAITLTSGDDVPGGAVSGAGFVGEDLVIALRADDSTRVLAVDLATGSARTLGGLPGTYGESGGLAYAHGSWVTEDGVYAGSCYTSLAQLYHLPLSRDADGELVAGDTQSVASDPNRLLACRPVDGGFAWVDRTTEGERLMLWEVATGVAKHVATLPESYPGVGQQFDEQTAGVLDLARLGDDWLVLLADRTGAEPGAYVARFDPAASEWALGEPFGRSTQAPPGAVCVGPLPLTDCFEDLGRFGCAPAACPVQVDGQRLAASAYVHRGYLLVASDEVHAFYLVEDGARNPEYLGGFEVQHRKVHAP